MNRRVVVVIGLSILLVVVTVLAATQEFKNPSSSHTAYIQEIRPLSDSAPETPAVTDEDLLNFFLTEEQRATLEKQPEDIASVFSNIATQFQSVSGDSNA